MPDEKRPKDQNTPPDDSSRAGDDLSASTIFVEMMRQAAARRAAMGLTPDQPTPPAPPAERQPPQHVTPKQRPQPPRAPDTSVAPPLRAPEPPAQTPEKGTNDVTEGLKRTPTDAAPSNDDQRVRPEHLPASRRAGRPRRETPTETQPAVNAEAAKPAPTPVQEPPREQPPTPITQPPAAEPSVSISLAPEAPQEDRRLRPAVRRMQAAPPPPAPVDEVEADEAEDLEDEDAGDGAIQEQKIRRVQRRKERQFRRRAGIIGGFVRTAIIVLIAAGLASTIFTWFTRPDFINAEVASDLEVARATGVYVAQPTALPTPNWLRKIGVVSGHRGPQSDPGAVCPDGLTEASINFAVAQIVVKNLRAQGFSVDLLDEFDPRLDNYQAAALVSIHANTCQDWGERVSGFLVAKAAARPEGGLDTLLAECIAGQYGLITGLERRTNLTVDMTDYHSFREIHPLTPASIIELGFLKDDREILTTRQDDMARAVTEGILCFLKPQTPLGGLITATPSTLVTTPITPTSSLP